MKDSIAPASMGSTKTTSVMLPRVVAATPLQWNVSFPSLRGSQDAQLGTGFRLLGLCLIVIGIVILITGKGYLAILVSFFIMVILVHLSLPATYRVDSDGIERRVLGRRQFKRWADFESARTNDLVLWLFPKQNLLRIRYRTALRVPLCKQGNTSCEQLQRIMPLRVQPMMTDQHCSTDSTVNLQ